MRLARSEAWRAWESRAGSALRQATARIHLLAATTPVNLAAELARIEPGFRRGEPIVPVFAYRPREGLDGLRRALEILADGLPSGDELTDLYADRARELALEAAIADRAGEPGLPRLAQLRYARRDAFDDAADALAKAWSAAEIEPPGVDGPLVRSDDAGAPSSLLSRMREEVASRGLPVRVIVRENASALAATGDGVVQVAAGVALARRDVERTVLHELDGHVAPTLRAREQALAIFAVGTAFGSDDQEGRALVLEHRAGFHDGARRRELGLRHLAARATQAGASFVEVTRALLDRGADLLGALRVTARAQRGGGLAREVVYLPAFLRVRAALGDPRVDAALASGKVSVSAAPRLAELLAPRD